MTLILAQGDSPRAGFADGLQDLDDRPEVAHMVHRKFQIQISEIKRNIVTVFESTS
jgi:molybdopterin-guanine dinucleotide biosynthesis protein A